MEPDFSFIEVAALASKAGLNEHDPDVTLGQYVTLHRRVMEPLACFHRIRCHALAIVIADAKVVLCLCMPSYGRLANLTGGLDVVDWF